MIGLAVMWASLARNLASKGFSVAVYNRTREVTEEFIDEYWDSEQNPPNPLYQGGKEKGNLTPYFSLRELVTSLERPRKIMIMVKAGSPVDAVIDELVPLLDTGDMIIDCGNSHFEDTIRREKSLREKWIAFIGCWVSGGEEWALHGPSIMPWCRREAYKNLEPFLEKIAARDFSGWSCVTHIGTDGAGHFVKMVHNGIEYAVMQMMAEAYDIFRKGYSMSAGDISRIFARYNEWLLDSYLFEIAVEVLAREDELFDLETGNKSPQPPLSRGSDIKYLIDSILDVAWAKGTGLWTSETALRSGKPTPSIVEATFARMISGERALRTDLAQIYEYDHSWLPEKDGTIDKIEHTLYLGMLLAYAQGLTLIESKSREMSWDIDLSEVTRIWQGGCIIRSQILTFLTEAFGSEKSIPSILALPNVIEAFERYLPDYQGTLTLTTQAMLSTPALSSAYHYFLSITTRDSSANFIQGLRDYFWAHTYERTDREGVFHTDWN
jgi:6-phosphogluconate dehydrogenase